MKVNAIVYTSNTGYTAEYARLLGEKTGLPVFPLERAQRELPKGEAIVYLGWLMASQVKGYKAAKKRFAVRAVCGVGMGANGSQRSEVRRANGIEEDIPLFTLQGGFDMNRLHGLYKGMMRVMVRLLGKRLAGKESRTPEENDMLLLMTQGGSRVSTDNLGDVIALLEEK